MREFAESLSGTSLSLAIQTTFWFIRLLQATHLLTAGVVLVSGVMIALRVLGWQRADQPFAAVWARFAPFLAAGLAVMVSTGIAQTLGDPVRELTSTSYWVKLLLVLSCVIGTLVLARHGRHAPANGVGSSTKLLAIGLIAFWCAIALLGRMIAYDRAIWGSLSLRT